MKYFRIVFFLTIGFTAGYLTKGYLDYQSIDTQKLVEATTGLSGSKNPNTRPDSVQITYINGQFNPAKVRILLGNTVIVINDSDALMWLVSDYEPLNTRRGYTRDNKKTVKMEKPGTFVLTNKLNLDAKAEIEVYKK